MSTEAGGAAVLAPLKPDDAARNQCGNEMSSDLNGVGIQGHNEVILLRKWIVANDPP